MNTTERLEELLNQKDNEIRELNAKLEEIEEAREWRWTLHTDRKVDTHDLPVPRLEMRCEPYYEGTWSSQIWTYSLVYRHFLGHLVWVPLGETKRTGGGMEAPPALDDLPFRDGAHIKHDSGALNLPAFVVIEDRTQRIEPRTSNGVPACEVNQFSSRICERGTMGCTVTHGAAAPRKDQGGGDGC